MTKRVRLQIQEEGQTEMQIQFDCTISLAASSTPPVKPFNGEVNGYVVDGDTRNEVILALLKARMEGLFF